MFSDSFFAKCMQFRDLPPESFQSLKGHLVAVSLSGQSPLFVLVDYTDALPCMLIFFDEEVPAMMKILDDENIMSPFLRQELIAQFKCIQLDFLQLIECTGALRKLIRQNAMGRTEDRTFLPMLFVHEAYGHLVASVDEYCDTAEAVLDTVLALIAANPEALIPNPEADLTPLVSLEDGRVSLSTLPVVPYTGKTAEPYTEAIYDNKWTIESVQSLKKRGIMHAVLVCYEPPEQIQSDLRLPFVLLMDGPTAKDQYYFTQPIYSDLLHGASKILDSLSLFLVVTLKQRPEIIRVQDDRTRALLSDFCQKTGIRLEQVSPTNRIAELENALWLRQPNGDARPV